jgi:hypothetical protein
MDSRQPNADAGDTGEYRDDEEIEVTREELIDALKEVVTNLSDGLKGADAEAYRTADDLAQNDWFFAGVSDRPGQYAVTMWPAEGDEDMLRIDIGSEEDVHNLAGDQEQIAALTDDFIEGMSEEYDEDYDEDEDEELEDEDLEEDEEDEEEYDEGEEEGVSQDGSSPR